jgi:hypothetical protein
MSDIDFRALMEPVARKLLGEPNHALSKDGELRFGSRGSLSVNLTNGTWYDHEAGKGGGVLDLIIYKKAGYNREDADEWLRGQRFTNGHDASPARGKAKKGRIDATYPYVDENGELLFEVVRFEPKDFRQRRPDGHDGWIWNLKGTRRVLYRLPELIEAVASGHVVAYCEGEKDADNVRALGIPATTNPGGVKKWRPEYAEHLRGADLVFLPHNDDAGREHMGGIAAALADVASRLRTLDIAKHWPDCPLKGDISNWIESGGTAEQFWELVKLAPESTAPEQAKEPEPKPEAAEGVSLDDFHAFMPMHHYIYAPTRELWPAASVSARVPPVEVLDEKGNPKTMSATAWLDQNRSVEQMTWAPGLPMLIRDKLISDGGWIARNKVACFNLYRPPTIIPGDAAKAGPWLDHVHKVYPAEAEHILSWLAHRVQRPQEKINHALVLGGGQGVGKDTALQPVKSAVGPWNFADVSPIVLLGRFNRHLRSVIVRISEARDLGDVDRFSFYDHMKAIIAAPPDVLRIDEKHLREYTVPNVCGVIITTNHRTDGIYLPPDDRRHFVAWSGLGKDRDFAEGGYWTKLYAWYERGGDRHVAAYLVGRDISAFDPKAPPPKTAAFWDIVEAGRVVEDAELADTLDDMGNPAATTLVRIQGSANGDFAAWLADRKNRRAISHRLETCGYVAFRNNQAGDGMWRINGKRQMVYVRKELSVREQSIAVRDLAS